MLNQKFGLWTVVDKDESKHGYWICKCECGTVRAQPATRLRRGVTKSCGCNKSSNISKAKTKIPEGEPSYKTKPKLYQRWNQMKQRCNNPNVKAYKYYGAAGVKVCESWSRSFRKFYEDVGDPPGDDYELDREDTQKGYEPGNVVWRKKIENIRRRDYTLKVMWEGEERSMKSVCDELGLKYKSVHMRMKRRNETPLEAIAHLLHKSNH